MYFMRRKKDEIKSRAKEGKDDREEEDAVTAEEDHFSCINRTSVESHQEKTQALVIYTETVLNL